MKAKAIERHRQTWQGKSDEWLFERLDNELKQKVEEIHRLLSENKAQTQQFNTGSVINWVAVSERLPEIPSENYLVVKNGIVGISLFRGDWSKFQCDLNDIQHVTHWAECPKPPCL
jgi:hypothetical protein